MSLLQTKYLNFNPFLAVARDRSNKFQIIKYKSILGEISQSSRFGFNEHTQTFIDFLTGLKSSDLIALGSNFFWGAVHRLDSALEGHEKDSISAEFNFFLLNAFDSFYGLCPESYGIQFEWIDPEKLILPSLNFYSEVREGAIIKLFKGQNHSLVFCLNDLNEHESVSHEIDLERLPSGYQLNQETIGSINVLYQTGLAIFEKHYQHDCCSDVYFGHLLTNKVNNALKIISVADEVLFGKINNHLSYIIPFGNDVNGIYPNFAIATLKKTIFLSINLLSEPDVILAESIIHEYSHCELHIVQDTILLTRIGNDIHKFYSPWRKDPRPALGLIHAIYVGHEICCFYYALILSNQTYDRPLAKDKIELISHQIHVAVKQLDHDDLSDFTIQLLDMIWKTIDEIIQELEISLETVPAELVEHMDQWESKNKFLNKIRR